CGPAPGRGTRAHLEQRVLLHLQQSIRGKPIKRYAHGWAELDPLALDPGAVPVHQEPNAISGSGGEKLRDNVQPPLRLPHPFTAPRFLGPLGLLLRSSLLGKPSLNPRLAPAPGAQFPEDPLRIGRPLVMAIAGRQRRATVAM